MGYLLFSAIPPAQPELFRQQVERLLREREPWAVWVDNCEGDGRCWRVFAAYARHGVLSRDCVLRVGAYQLVLHRGSRVTADGVSGGFTFSRGTFCAAGQEVALDGEGRLSFPLRMADPAQLDAGIYYSTSVYRRKLRRNLVESLYSPLFAFDRPLEMEARFFPAPVADCSFRARAETGCVSLLSTIYGHRVPLRLKAGFAFTLAEKPDINGWPAYYLVPSGEAAIAGENAEENLRIMVGTSGTEYVAAGRGGVLTFHAGQAAYFGGFPIRAKPTTSHVCFEQALYYTQPQQASYYEQREGFFTATELAGIPMQRVIMPVFPFLDGVYDPALAQEVEGAHLAPLRRKRVEGAVSVCRGNGRKIAVARNGMKVCVDGGNLLWMRVACSGGKNTPA